MSVAVLSAIAAMLAAAGDTLSAPPPDGDGIAIDAVGGCPEVTAVRRLLANLVSPEEAHVAPISIQDRGTQYRVAVRESAAMIDDPTRNCTDRARHAAVFAANELHAPKIVLGPPEFTIEKGLIFEIASNNGGVVWAPGAEFRGAYGSKRWSLFGSAGARGPVTLMLDHDWQAELLRFPLDAGGRITGYYGRFRPWLTVGGSLTVTGIIGQELVQTEREWRVDVGALAMVGATLRITQRLGLSAALTVRWYPRRYQLQVVPAGTVGETPAWWFGIAGDYTLDGKGSTPP